MILLTNGDSWTQGDSSSQKINWNAEKTEDWYDIVPGFGDKQYVHKYSHKQLYKFYDSSVWPKELGKRLGVETWNAGRNGCDNTSITVRTINSVEWLLNKGKKDIFVVIGWSSKLRLPAYVYKDNKLKLMQNRPYYINDFADKAFNLQERIEETFLINILTLQNYFSIKKINYLFFNSFDNFDYFDKLYLNPLIDKSKWVNCSLNQSHFKNYILQKYNLDSWDDSLYFDTSHPKDISHKAWGKYLYNYIQTL